jgi:hypothetical protein
MPPCPEDLSAQINREWTYQRPYTTIELYSKNKDIQTQYTVPNQLSTGWGGYCIGVISKDQHTFQEALKQICGDSDVEMIFDPFFDTYCANIVDCN